MTFMHEVLHSNVAEGGATGHGDEIANFESTGKVVDRMNIIRGELNAQGGNYGNRESYKSLYFNPQTKKPSYLPFDRASQNSMNNGNPPAENTMYLQIN